MSTSKLCLWLRRSPSKGLWSLSGAVLLSLLATASGLAASLPEAVEGCLGCHGDPDLSTTLDDGATWSLWVDAEVYEASTHGRDLLCTDCHEGDYEEEHPSGRSFPSPRAYAIQAYDLCKKCHFDTYTRTLESVHYEYLSEGFESVPVCADCHGAHDVQDPHEKQTMISRSCGSCHQDVFEVYRKSVHGSALSVAGEDIPGCADCHTAHDIDHPDALRFRLRSPETCLRCHGDPEIVRRYGLSDTVGTTYLADFHGVTASLSANGDIEPDRVVVVCVDCHGYHGIESPAARGAEAMKAQVETACLRCHQEAPAGFTAAWLSHYPPTLQRAPLVYLVTLFYRLFIPFVVLGLLLQVCLHLYRVGIRR